MKIKLKQNIDGLMALDKLCNIILGNEMCGIDAKIVKSITYDIHKLVKSPLQKAQENNNLFDNKKKYTITLKFHEAYALHEGIIGIIHTVNNEYQKVKLNQIKDFLNQKLI